MLQMSKLNEIDTNNFKNAINYNESNKIYIRLGIFTDILHNLDPHEQLNALTNLIFNTNNNYVLIKTVNNIEWTPEKLYQAAYYMISMNNKFWLISHSSYQGFVVKSCMTIKKYLEYVFNIVGIDNNATILDRNLWCNSNELHIAYNLIIESNIDFQFIKQTGFQNSFVKINHYLYKKNNTFYYFCISNKSFYKPIIYK